MTRWKERFDVVQNSLEWFLIGLMLIVAVWLVWSIPEVTVTGANGPIASLVGIKLAAWAYAIIWSVESLLLAYAKIFKKMRLRKWTLFAIYVTHQFTFFLALGLRGIGWHLVDNAIISGLAAWLWLRAKLNYDYVEWEDLETFDED